MLNTMSLCRTEPPAIPVGPSSSTHTNPSRNSNRPACRSSQSVKSSTVPKRCSAGPVIASPVLSGRIAMEQTAMQTVPDTTAGVVKFQGIHPLDYRTSDKVIGHDGPASLLYEGDRPSPLSHCAISLAKRPDRRFPGPVRPNKVDPCRQNRNGGNDFAPGDVPGAQRLPTVAHRMPAVGDPDGRRRPPAGAIGAGAGPVAHDDPDRRML